MATTSATVRTTASAPRLPGATGLASAAWTPVVVNGVTLYRYPWTGGQFHDLYENGVRANKARTPDVDVNDGSSTTADRVTAGWKPAADGHLQVYVFAGGNQNAVEPPTAAWARWNWASFLLPVTAFDLPAGIIRTALALDALGSHP